MKVHKSDQKLVSLINPNMETGPWIAGGAPLKWFNGQGVGKADIDVFCKNERQVAEIAALLSDDTKDDTWRGTFKTNNAFTLVSEIHDQKIQLITCAYFNSAKEVIDRFDFSVCQIVTDGKEFIFGETTVKDIRTKKINVVKFNAASIIKRLCKYTNYGYTPTEEMLDLIESRSSEITWLFDMSNFENSEYDNAF